LWSILLRGFFQDGRVTFRKRLRELLGVEDEDYVRLEVAGVIKPKVKKRLEYSSFLYV
jgi:hypothetical protein